MIRQLADRVETYTELIQGACSCGEPAVKVLGSSCTMWVNGNRFHYPGELTAWSIFRCKTCKEPIHKTFRASFAVPSFQKDSLSSKDSEMAVPLQLGTLDSRSVTEVEVGHRPTEQDFQVANLEQQETKNG